MKRTLFLASLLASCLMQVPMANAANLTLTGAAVANETQYLYNGDDLVLVNKTGGVATTSSVTFNLSDAVKYVNSTDAYKAQSNYLLGWTTNSIASYGIVLVSDGNGGVKVKASLNGEIWDPKQNNQTVDTFISYETLQELAKANDDGNVTLTISNTKNDGITVSYGSDAKKWSGLHSSSATTVTAYHVMSDINTTVDLQTAGSDLVYTDKFVSKSGGEPSIGRVLFAGDSITHGVKDATWRWQLFKTLTDNGIENEINGPRMGNFSTSITSDAAGANANAASFEYGGVTFENDHLAQGSGRVRNILEGDKTYDNVIGEPVTAYGAGYSGHTAWSTTHLTDYDTIICLMGTNDLLSDSGSSTDDYKRKMADLLGGSVTYSAGTDKVGDETYTWTRTDSDDWGNMGKLVGDLLAESNDKLYLMEIPTWTLHFNNDDEPNHKAVEQYNVQYAAWVKAYNEAHGTDIKLVSVNDGLVDKTKSTSFYGHEDFFNQPGTNQRNGDDGLHPNEQGSLIIAGNLAKEMGIGGRTAGLARAAMGTQGTEWTALSVGSDGVVAAGQNLTLAEDIFTINDGYTVDFGALFGDGEENEWLGKDAASMSITVADGVHSGTLKLSEGYIMWGDTVLFCQDNSKLTDEGNLRIAWHNGNAADNVLSGYYVWLGDMLIGQACESTATLNGFNGITLSTQGAEALIRNLTYANTAYAPTLSSTQMSSVQYGYLAEQDVAIRNATSITSGVTYQNVLADDKSTLSAASNDATVTLKHTSKAHSGAWRGLTQDTVKRNFNYQESGSVATIFGALDTNNNGGEVGGKLVVDVEKGAEVAGGYYSPVSAGIVGAFKAASADEFNVFINGGTIGSHSTYKAHIVGGAILGAGKIGKVNIVVNDGYIRDNIYGGSYGDGASGATVGSATITINGGRIDGDIVAGGTSGTIGNTDIVINGGYIGGHISKGTATRSSNAAVATVTVVGNKADIRGNIEADKVTLKDVSKLANYSNGFDNYSGTIKTPELVLDNVQTEMSASYDGLQKLSALNGTNTSLIGGDALSLEELSLGAGTTVGLFKGADRTVSTATETMLTVTGSLTIAGEGATLNANLVLTADSTLNLGANSLELGSSLTLGGGALDDATLAAVLGLESGRSLELFTGVDELIVGNGSYTGATELAASVAFNNAELAAPDFRLVYTGATAGGMVSIMSIPEPTTATLSLLALAGLAARRRRK